jgi:RNA polymerase sigma-70 factor (ECF subfamily)
VDHLRKQRPETELTPEIMQAQKHMPRDTAQQQQEESLLHRALMSLPEEKREVLILSRLQELKYDEIAKIMNCNVITVRTRVHRALEDLRQAFHAVQAQSGAQPGAAGAASGGGLQ